MEVVDPDGRFSLVLGHARQGVGHVDTTNNENLAVLFDLAACL